MHVFLLGGEVMGGFERRGRKCAALGRGRTDRVFRAEDLVGWISSGELVVTHSRKSHIRLATYLGVVSLERSPCVCLCLAHFGRGRGGDGAER